MERLLKRVVTEFGDSDLVTILYSETDERLSIETPYEELDIIRGTEVKRKPYLVLVCDKETNIVHDENHAQKDVLERVRRDIRLYNALEHDYVINTLERLK